MRKHNIAVCSDPRSPFARQVIEGVAKYSVERGDWSLQMTSGVPFLTLSLMNEWRGDGFIGGVTAEWHRKLLRDGIPFVNISSQYPDLVVPSVVIDNDGVGRMAAEHLIDKGLRNFAMAAFKHDRKLNRRVEAFVQRIKQEGLVCLVLRVRRVMRHGEVVEQDMSEVRQYLQKLQGPVGLFAMDDPMARGIVQVCQEMGRQVPEEVAVLGEGNWPIVGNIMMPPLSSIDLGADRIGYRAAQVLQAILDGGKAPPEPIFIPPLGVIQRRSTDMFAIEDREVCKALRFIHENCRRPVQVSDVQEAAIVNRRTLERRFARYVGRTISKELRRARIRVACQILSDTDLPISEVSTACGYLNRQRFNVAFSRETGMTPSTYRRTHRC